LVGVMEPVPQDAWHQRHSNGTRLNQNAGIENRRYVRRNTLKSSGVHFGALARK